MNVNLLTCSSSDLALSFHGINHHISLVYACFGNNTESNFSSIVTSMILEFGAAGTTKSNTGIEDLGL
jgi:hypothetical protein